MVEVPDGTPDTEPVFCSLTCAIVDGWWNVRYRTKEQIKEEQDAWYKKHAKRLQLTEIDKESKSRLEQKRPLPPEILASALQDRIHETSGMLSRAAKVKIPKGESKSCNCTNGCKSWDCDK